MVVERNVARGGIEVRRLDARHLHPAVWSGGRGLDVAHDVGERLAVIHAELQIAIVGANPNHAGTRWRLANLRSKRTRGIAVVLGCHGLLAGNAHDGLLGSPAVDILAEV